MCVFLIANKNKYIIGVLYTTCNQQTEKIYTFLIAFDSLNFANNNLHSRTKSNW